MKNPTIFKQIVRCTIRTQSNDQEVITITTHGSWVRHLAVFVVALIAIVGLIGTNMHTYNSTVESLESSPEFAVKLRQAYLNGEQAGLAKGEQALAQIHEYVAAIDDSVIIGHFTVRGTAETSVSYSHTYATELKDFVRRKKRELK